MSGDLFVFCLAGYGLRHRLEEPRVVPPDVGQVRRLFVEHGNHFIKRTLTIAHLEGPAARRVHGEKGGGVGSVAPSSSLLLVNRAGGFVPAIFLSGGSLAFAYPCEGETGRRAFDGYAGAVGVAVNHRRDPEGKENRADPDKRPGSARLEFEEDGARAHANKKQTARRKETENRRGETVGHCIIELFRQRNHDFGSPP